MTASVVVSGVLEGFTGSGAQLPPEIMADPPEPRTAINKILDLQNEHELDLPEAFHWPAGRRLTK